MTTRAFAAAIVRRQGRTFRKVWSSRGGGFYGFVAALTFLYLEASNLVSGLAGMNHLPPLNAGTLIGWVVGNLLQVLGNLVRSAAWPLAWIRLFGVGLTSGALLLGAVVLFRAVRPSVERLLEGLDDGAAIQPAAPGSPAVRAAPAARAAPAKRPPRSP